MLRITMEANGKVIVRDLLVIDSHSHMGKDVDGAEMMNPSTPGKGTFDFWTMVENRIRKDWEQGKSAQQFTANIKGVSTKITLDFVQMPVVSEIAKSLEFTNKGGSYAEYYQRIQHQKLIDQAVCFPFQDVFRDKHPEALYRASNTNIARQVSRFPVSTRMIGYMRCDPQEGQKAINEIEFWGQKGQIRGLKLHPRSEGWVDHVTSQQAVQALITAAKYNWPVIFDTRGKQTILDIADLIRITRQTIQNQYPELLSQFKVIIAHFAQGNVDDEEVYRAITQPNTWGDLSMLHGKGVSAFLQSFRTWCDRNQIAQRTGRTWSEFLLFGTDYPYFGDMHAKELIVYLFNQDFFEGGGTLSDSANILGLNQIRLLPEYGGNYRFKNTGTPTSAFLQAGQFVPKNTVVPQNNSQNNSQNNYTSSQDLRYHTLARLIESNTMNIEKLLFQFKGDWHNFQHEYILLTKSKQNSNIEVPLASAQIEPNELDLIYTPPNNALWNPLDNSFFKEGNHSHYRSALIQSFPAIKDTEASQHLKKSYLPTTQS